MMPIANALIYSGITAAVALSVGFWLDWRLGCLVVPIGAIVTGVLLAARGGIRR